MEGNDDAVVDTMDKENSILLNADTVEERFRVDRRKLEEMIRGTGDIEDSPAGKFFQKISEETGVEIFWPTRLKIGAKSKKDPNIKICGKAETVLLAKQKILEILDTKRNKVTLKMDVPFTDHSHIIGKGGSTIQSIMEETECHIHFPDSNRTSTMEKSNQVSVTGQSAGVEKARCKLRSLLPIVVSFEVTAGSYIQTLPDPSSPAIQLILQNYGFVASFHQYNQKRMLVTARGAQNQFARFRQGLYVLMEYITGNDEFKIPVTLRTDIAAQNHQGVMGPANIHIQHIKRTCGVSIAFQASLVPASEMMPQFKSAVFITGTFDNVHKAWKQLTGYLPLSLSFNLKEGQDVVSDHITKMMSDFKVNIMMRLKKKENVKTITVQGTEKDSRLLFEVRRQILGLDESEVPVCCDRHAAVLASALYLATMSLTDTTENDSRKKSCHNERLKVINEFHTTMGTANRNVLPVQATTDPKLSSILSNVLEQLNKSSIDRPIPTYQPFPTSLPPAEFCIPQTSCRPVPYVKRQNNANPSTSASSKLPLNASKPIGRTAFPTLQQKPVFTPSNVCNPFFTSDIWSPQTEVMSSWPCSEPSSHFQRTASVMPNFNNWPLCSDVPIPETLHHSDLGWLTESSRNPTHSVPFHNQYLNTHSLWDQGSSGVSSINSSPPSSVGSSTCFCKNSFDKSKTVNSGASAKPRQKPVLQISKENDANIYSMLGRNSSSTQGNSSMKGSSLVKPDYDEKWFLASKALQQPLDNEERTPTSMWAGYGFSKSMPDKSFRDKLNFPNKLNNAEMDKENQNCNISSEDVMPRKSTSNSGDPVFSCSDCFDTITKEFKLSCGDFNKLPQLFSKLALDKYTNMFVENEIDLSTFLSLNDADLQELGVTYKARKKMLLAISELTDQFRSTKADVFRAAPGAERKALLTKLAELTSAQDS